jgi:hypothetical protein
LYRDGLTMRHAVCAAGSEDWDSSRRGTPEALDMVFLAISAAALFAAYTLFATVGSPQAAAWLTGATGGVLLVSYGLARS